MCWGRSQRLATGLAGILGHQQALLQGGKPASLRNVSAGTFGCLQRLEQMFVCFGNGRIKCSCVKTLARETNVCFRNRHLDCWNITTSDIGGGENIHLIWETILGSSTNQNTNQGGKRMRLKLDPVRTNQGRAALFPMFLLVSQQQHKRRVIYFLLEA